MNDPNHTESGHRLTERLQNYWEEVRGGKPVPDEADINPDHIADIWPSCFLINVRDTRFRYDYLGLDLVEAYGSDVSGQEICEALVYPNSPTLFNAMQQALRGGYPVEDHGEFINHAGAAVRYRCIVLPLVSHGDPATRFILGGMRWRWYSRYENAAD